MTDKVIRIVIDPDGTTPGRSAVEGDLQSIQSSAQSAQQSLNDLADVSGSATDNLTSGVSVASDAFVVASEATERLRSSNQDTFEDLQSTADGFRDAADAAKSLTDTGDGFDDLRRRMASLSDEADRVSGRIRDGGSAAEESAEGVSGSFSVLTTSVKVLGGLALAIGVVALAAVATREETRREFRGLGRDTLDLGRATIEAFRSIFEPVGDVLDDLVANSRSLVQDLTSGVLEFAGVTDFVTTEQRLFNEAFRESRDLGEDFASGAIGGLGDFSVELIRAREELGLTTSELIRFRAEGVIDDGFNDLTNDFASAIAEVRAELEAGNIEQIEAAARTQALVEQQALAIENYDQLSGAVRRYAEDLAVATERQDALDEALATFEGLRSAEDVFDETREQLRLLFDEGEISAVEFAQALGQALDNIDLDTVETQITELEKIARRGARGIVRALGDSLAEPFDDILATMAENFALTLIQMTSDALAATIVEAIFGIGRDGEGGSSGLGDFFARLLGGRQHGGSTQAGLPYVVGETEPEIFVPATAGTVLPGSQINIGSPPPPALNIMAVNTFDPQVVLDVQGSAQGNVVFLNNVRSNRTQIRNMLR